MLVIESTMRRSKCAGLVLGVLLVLASIHFIILPTYLGYYNDDCLLSAERYRALKELHKEVVTSYNELEQQYWIDHGLLIGYYRQKDILAHDGDIDFGRIKPAGEGKFDKNFKLKMAQYKGTEGNSMVATKNYTEFSGHQRRVQADLFRYEIKTVNNKTYIVEYWNKQHKDLRFHMIDKHFIKDIPYEVIFPLKWVMFLGVNTSIPNDVERLLSIRYTADFKRPIPYKWKCYLSWHKLS